METDSTGGARRRLSLVDTISVIIGIVIGVGIYETPPLVFQNVSGVWSGLGVWALGGALCLVGAFTYAELASTYPRSGGDYVYLTRAFGPWAGFLFGWAQLAVILTANIGMMAYIFGDYAARFFGTGPDSSFTYAVGAVVALSVLNVFGVSVGKVAQNVLSSVKVLGLGGIVAAAIYLLARGTGGGDAAVENAAAASATPAAAGSIAFAMVLVFLTYGGWNDAAFVVADMQDSQRIVPALILGTLAITVIYLAVNGAYLAALGLQGVRGSNAVAADVLTKAFDETGGRAISALVMISALGAANGLIYTGSRLCATVGADYSIFAALGRWHPQWRSPVYALAAQAVISLLMIAAVGSQIGQESLNQAFSALGMEELNWEGRGGFDSLLRCTAPIFWLFFLLTSLSLFVLRWKDPHITRPFTAPFYPLTPLLFSATCGYMLYSGLNYAGRFGLVGAALLVIGLPLYFVSRRTASGEQP